MRDNWFHLGYSSDIDCACYKRRLEPSSCPRIDQRIKAVNESVGTACWQIKIRSVSSEIPSTILILFIRNVLLEYSRFARINEGIKGVNESAGNSVRVNEN